MQDWPDAPANCHASQDANAILIFMPGAPEITRLVRQLDSSSRLRQAAQGQLRVLPLHGALPSQAQVHLAAIVLTGQVSTSPLVKAWLYDCVLLVCASHSFTRAVASEVQTSGLRLTDSGSQLLLVLIATCLTRCAL